MNNEVDTFLAKIKKFHFNKRYHLFSGVGIFDAKGKFKGIMSAEQFFKEQKIINYQSFLNQCSGAKGIFSYYNSGNEINFFAGINEKGSLIERQQLIELVAELPRLNEEFLCSSLNDFLNQTEEISKKYQVSFINVNLKRKIATREFFTLLLKMNKKIAKTTVFYPYQLKLKKVKLSELDLKNYIIKDNQIVNNKLKVTDDNFHVILVPRVRLEHSLTEIFRILDFDKLQQAVLNQTLYAKFYDFQKQKYCSQLLDDRIKNNIYHYLLKNNIKFIKEVAQMVLKVSPFLAFSKDDFKFDKQKISQSKFKLMFVKNGRELNYYLANNLFATFGVSAEYKQSPSLISNQFYSSSFLHQKENSKRKLYASKINGMTVIFLQNNNLNNAKNKLLKKKIAKTIENGQINYLN